MVAAAAAAKSLQSCPTLCDPIDGSPPGSPIPGILQARTLEWVAVSFSKRNYRKKESEVAQLCPTLCIPMDCNLAGSSIHGIFQARVLEWVAIMNIYEILWLIHDCIYIRGQTDQWHRKENPETASNTYEKHQKIYVVNSITWENDGLLNKQYWYN